jgi:hypothetical protein
MAASMNPPAVVETCSPLLTKCFGGSAELERLARRVGFQRRKARKLTAAAFLSGALHAVLTHKQSTRDLAMSAGLAMDTTVSRQGLWKRINHRAHDFLSACLARVLAGVPTGSAKQCLPGCIRRVLVADSTVIALHPALASEFPGPSNQTGHTQAAVRIQTVLDLLKGTFVAFQLGSFRDNDQKAAGWMPDLLGAGDLILRDLGYYTLDSLRSIAAKGAFFITRLRFDTSLFHEDATPLDLCGELRAATGDLVALSVRAGAAAQLPVRLVAVRLSPQEAAKRRREARANRDRRLKLSPKKLELLGWSITLDNLPPQIPASRVYPLYALRWQVEIVFKSWKTHLGRRRPLVGPLGGQQARATLMAHLIAAALVAHAQTSLVRVSTSPMRGEVAPPLSLLKTTPMIARLLIRAILPDADDPDSLWTQIQYHCRYEKRGRLNFPQSMNQAMSNLFNSLS